MESQNEKISYLESTLKSTNEKYNREPETNKKDATAIDTSRIPTFSHNIFTQEDEDVKQQSK